jgi:hypothetical protein
MTVHECPKCDCKEPGYRDNAIVEVSHSTIVNLPKRKKAFLCNFGMHSFESLLEEKIAGYFTNVRGCIGCDKIERYWGKYGLSKAPLSRAACEAQIAEWARAQEAKNKRVQELLSGLDRR